MLIVIAAVLAAFVLACIGLGYRRAWKAVKKDRDDWFMDSLGKTEEIGTLKANLLKANADLQQSLKWRSELAEQRNRARDERDRFKAEIEVRRDEWKTLKADYDAALKSLDESANELKLFKAELARVVQQRDKANADLTVACKSFEALTAERDTAISQRDAAIAKNAKIIVAFDAFYDAVNEPA